MWILKIPSVIDYRIHTACFNVSHSVRFRRILYLDGVGDSISEQWSFVRLCAYIHVLLEAPHGAYRCWSSYAAVPLSLTSPNMQFVTSRSCNQLSGSLIRLVTKHGIPMGIPNGSHRQLLLGRGTRSSKTHEALRSIVMGLFLSAQLFSAFDVTASSLAEDTQISRILSLGSRYQSMLLTPSNYSLQRRF